MNELPPQEKREDATVTARAASPSLAGPSSSSSSSSSSQIAIVSGDESQAEIAVASSRMSSDVGSGERLKLGVEAHENVVQNNNRS